MYICHVVAVVMNACFKEERANILLQNTRNSGNGQICSYHGFTPKYYDVSRFICAYCDIWISTKKYQCIYFLLE